MWRCAKCSWYRDEDVRKGEELGVEGGGRVFHGSAGSLVLVSGTNYEKGLGMKVVENEKCSALRQEIWRWRDKRDH